MANEVRVHVRIAEELKSDMERLKKATGLDDAAIVRACLESVVDYFNENEEISLPFVLLPKSAVKRLKAAAGEPAPLYRAAEAPHPAPQNSQGPPAPLTPQNRSAQDIADEKEFGPRRPYAERIKAGPPPGSKPARAEKKK